MAGAGIVSGFDMTSEAALAKLSYVLGHPGLTLDDRKEVPLGLWVWGQGSQGSQGHVRVRLGRWWGQPSRVCAWLGKEERQGLPVGGKHQL